MPPEASACWTGSGDRPPRPSRAGRCSPDAHRSSPGVALVDDGQGRRDQFLGDRDEPDYEANRQRGGLKPVTCMRGGFGRRCSRSCRRRWGLGGNDGRRRRRGHRLRRRERRRLCGRLRWWPPRDVRRWLVSLLGHWHRWRDNGLGSGRPTGTGVLPGQPADNARPGDGHPRASEATAPVIVAPITAAWYPPGGAWSYESKPAYTVTAAPTAATTAVIARRSTRVRTVAALTPVVRATARRPSRTPGAPTGRHCRRTEGA